MEQQFNFCKIYTNRDHQPTCNGCSRIQRLFDVQRQQESRGFFQLHSKTVCIHSTYRELDSCARKCVACRIFRQALFLKQFTTNDLSALKGEVGSQPIFAQLVRKEETSQAETEVRVSIGETDGYLKSARVCCTKLNTAEYLTLSEDPKNADICNQVMCWLRNCKEQHPECGNLRWSSSHPTRLVHILSDSKVELIHCVPTADKDIEYAALSYSWGDWNHLLEGEKKEIDDGKTTKSNLQYRSQSFASSELPTTIRDSITLMYRLGIEYIWVDTICIIQDDSEDWKQESARMHEVYGNACFTLCLCLSSKATECILRKREAWTLATTPCRLGDRWLTNLNMSLNEVRSLSPIASRAWTLQEERLSPRILYWSAQRMYWSCSVSQHSELGKTRSSVTKPPPRQSLGDMQSSSQSFLISCRKGQRKRLHDEWLNVASSYVLRQLSHKEDRFPALSGLASRYYLAQKDDEYIAGLWRNTFAEDLAWCVIQPRVCQKCESQREITSSWSWASLPFLTSTHFKPNFSNLPPSHFELLEKKHVQDDDPTAAVRRGAAVRRVKVRGRLQAFFQKGSLRRPWASISKVGKEEKYSFASCPEQSVHSTDLEHGRVLSYEARKEEVLGQLDYLEDAERVENGLIEVYCLEIGEGAMLFLESGREENEYRRIGVSHGYREDFFATVQFSEIVLV